MKYLIPFLCASAFIAVNVEPMISKFFKKLAKNKLKAKSIAVSGDKTEAIGTFVKTPVIQQPKEALIINMSREQAIEGKLIEVQQY